MAGRKTLRSIRMARETSNGTRATPRYLWRGVGDWVVDKREIVKVEEMIGVSGGSDRTYTPKLFASADIAETEATFEQLPVLFYSLGLTPRAGYNTFGTRVPALYTGLSGSVWRYGLDVPSTVFPTTYSYTIESGDNVEAQVALYAVTEELKLTFNAGEAAKISASMVAQYGTRTNAVGSFSAPGTLENVTVVLSSKTHSFDITPVTSSFIHYAISGDSTSRFWIASTIGVVNRDATEYRNVVKGTFRGAFAASAVAAWVVGASGSILFYNGSTWTAQTSGVSTLLYAVWGTSASSVWAVGASGVIRFFDGSSWASQSSGVGTDLRGVWGASASYVWAVGSSGVIRFFDGSTWASSTSGTAVTLHDVWDSGANVIELTDDSSDILQDDDGNDITGTSAVWAVGASGTIRYYNGSAWAAQTSGTTVTLYGVWGASFNNVWAVGENGTILYWDNIAWTAQVSNTTSDLYAVWGTSASNVWAVGENGTVLFWNGSVWQNVTSSVLYATDAVGNVLKGEVTVKALWAPKYWVDAGVIYPGTMVLTGHEISGNLTFEHQQGGTLSAAGSAGQIETWRSQQAQLLNMTWLDYNSVGSEVAFGLQLPFKWDTLQGYEDIDGNNVVSGDFTSKYNETAATRGFFFFQTGNTFSNIVGTI